MHTEGCWLWCASVLSQQISGVRKEQKEPTCLEIPWKFSRVEDLGSLFTCCGCAQTQSFGKLLGSNFLLYVHLIQCCAAHAKGAFEVCVAPVYKPEQLRVPGPVCTHWLWGLELSELSGAHTPRDSSFSLHLLAVQLPLQGLQMIPFRSRSVSCAVLPAVHHICTQPGAQAAEQSPSLGPGVTEEQFWCKVAEVIIVLEEFPN